MADFSSEDLTGARFEDVRLNGARFHDVDLSGASFRLVDLTGVGIRGAAVVDVEINGEVENLRVNGVDVGRFVEAELIRRHPEWARLRPASAAGYREIWPVLEGLWEETVARARSLPPDWLHQRVDGEWSFIETLRHLVFATDAWSGGRCSATRRPGIRSTCRTTRCRTGRAWSRATARPGRPWMRCWRCVPTGWQPSGRSSPVSPMSSWPALRSRCSRRGYPEPESFPVSRCLQCILAEEWHHRWYAERDLDVLQP